MTRYLIHPTQALKGTITVPGDKSISHRSLIFASLAQGESRLRGLLLGEDVLCTMRILQQMGVKMSHTPETIKSTDELIVYGQGLRSLKKPTGILDCGNSGTSLRLLMGLLSAQPFESILTGDASLNKRPVDRVMEPLKQMGAEFEIRHEHEKRFVVVKGHSNIKGGMHLSLKVASAQLKSAILLAALFADSSVTVTEPSLSRDHTERFLSGLGARLVRQQTTVTLTPPSALKPFSIDIPSDFSSAAFFMVAGLIVPNSEVLIKAVGLNPTRSGLLNVLKKMGGDITIENEHVLSGEPVGDIRVKSSQLTPVDISGDIIPFLIDEIPILSIAFAKARGESSVHDAHELRVKESDRIKTVCQELKKLGVKTLEYDDGFKVFGGTEFIANTFTSYGDHRLAMSFAVASLIAKNESTIEDIDCVATSFPGFFTLLESLKS